MKKHFDFKGWYDALVVAVAARKVTWVQVGHQTGVSPSTLSRLANGRRPDAASLAALSAWAGLNPAEFCPKVPPQQIVCPTCNGTGHILSSNAGVAVADGQTFLRADDAKGAA